MQQIAKRLGTAFLSESETNRQATALTLAACVIAFLSLAALLKAPPTHAIAYALAIAASAMTMFLVYKGYFWQAAFALIGIAFSLVAYFAFADRGNYYTHLLLYAVIFILIVSYLGKPIVNLFVLFGVAAAVIIYSSDRLLIPDPSLADEIAYYELFAVLAAIACFISILNREAGGLLRRSKEDAQWYIDRLDSLHQVDIAILAANSPVEIVEIGVSAIEPLIPFDAAGVMLFSFEEKIARSIPYKEGRGVFQKSQYTLVSWDVVASLRKGEYVLYADLQNREANSNAIRTLQNIGVRSLLLEPIAIEDRLFGALTMSSNEADAFSEKHIAISKQMGASLAVALHNAHLLEAEKEARQYAEMLQETMSVLNSKMELLPLLDAILDCLFHVIEFDGAAVFLLNDGNVRLAAQKSAEPGRERRPLSEQEQQSLAVLLPIVEQQRPFIIHDTRKFSDWIYLFGYENIRCWMAIPMIVRGKVVGLLTLDKNEPEFYAIQDAEHIQVFANQAAIAIENAQFLALLERRVNEQTRDLTALYNVTAIAATQHDLGFILDGALSETLTTLSAPAGLILVDQNKIVDSSWETPAFALVAQSGVSASQAALALEQLASNPEAMTLLIDKRESYLANEGTQLISSLIPHTFHSALLSPVQAGDRVLGVLIIFSSFQQPFNVEALALLSSIADQIGIAIENDRLRERAASLVVMEERKRVARELHDSVTQSLFSIILFSDAVNEMAANDKWEEMPEYLDDISSTAHQAFRETRLLLYELRDDLLEKQGLAAAIQYRLDTVEKRVGIQSKLVVEGELAIAPTAVIDASYRIIQEALNNALQHANANKVDINLAMQDKTFIVTIKDNGRGFDVQNVQTGMGIKNLVERAEEIQGALTIVSEPKVGTTIQGRFPL